MRILKERDARKASPAHAARARPSLMSYAISIIAFASAYSFVEPSFNVIIISYSFLSYDEYKKTRPYDYADETSRMRILKERDARKDI